MRRIVFSLIILLTISCNKQNHFITDKEYLETVKNDFKKVRTLANDREQDLFSVFNQNISLEESEALMFLYAYMPLNDLADYNGDFYLNNVRLALKTRETFLWGQQIPEDIFRHFVLPYRVNNENLDTSRAVFYRELSERLKGMDLREAILEVNHWCHEKVNYQSTDERTISPLGAVKSTFGRCGEESTFTVTAMRAAGIPARQCYTPRWAHTDDNHAWVEVWFDGVWHYLGACEPEPDIDIAWFSAPALRAMLVNSNVYGKYDGPEEIILKEDQYTNVNMLSNYAPVKTIYIKVLNENSEIAKNSMVEFQLYNYAEFYPIASKQVDENGLASLMTGYGDLLIWAYNENEFAYQKITVEQTDTVILKIHPQDGKEFTELFDITPPISKEPKTVSASGDAENKIRLKQEDDIREAYAATFMNKSSSKDLAVKNNLDTSSVWNFIQKSRGNYSEIVDFTINSSKIKPDFTLALLESIAEKDLRDTESKTLISHIQHSFTYAESLPEKDKELFINYVLNPRIANEKLIDYKSFLQNAFGAEFIANAKHDIYYLVNWIQSEITINDKANYYNVPITARGVYELMVSDSYSRDLFFVAACRSFGIPSRLEPATKIPQYFTDKWINVDFGKKSTDLNKMNFGTLKLKNSSENEIAPLYYIHYTLSKFENGKYHTLDYGWDTPFDEMPEEIVLEAGNYLLITGNRQPDGSVLTAMQFFSLKENETKEIILQIRKNAQALIKLGELTTPEILKSIDNTTILVNKNDVCIFGWIDTGKEPTKHTLKDIGSISSAFELLNCKIYLLGSKENISNSIISDYSLPKSTVLINDQNQELLKTFNPENIDLPLFIVVKNNEVYYISEGYQIGIGEQLIKTINKLE